MNVLWISNITFPEAMRLLGIETKQNGSGGWLLGAAETLVNHPEIKLTILSVDRVIQMTYLKGGKIDYYIIPQCKHMDGYGYYMQEIRKRAKPDVIHIQGTEFPYGLAWIKACSSENVVVSIQGLVSVISRYYFAGLSNSEIIKNITLRDVVARKTIFDNQKEFVKRGKYEIELLKNVKCVVGRTYFDYAHSKAINPEVKYYHCDEALRDSFYSGLWTYNGCSPHTIFVSQSNYPVKGLHLVLKALPLIIKKYPDLKLRIAGSNLVSSYGVLKSFRQTGYGRLINSLIKKNHLEGYIYFTGRLNAEEMKQEYLNANVFICPSSIENSPNSLCEAQILGVPMVASFVGGIPNLMEGAEKYLYRFDEIEILAEKVCEIFKSEDRVSTTLLRQKAQERHDREKIVSDMISIYENVKGNN